MCTFKNLEGNQENLKKFFETSVKNEDFNIFFCFLSCTFHKVSTNCTKVIINYN